MLDLRVTGRMELKKLFFGERGKVDWRKIRTIPVSAGMVLLFSAGRNP
jgi:hypothetical protein